MERVTGNEEDQANSLRVVVVGGGTAGWMSAAALAAVIPEAAHVHLVESAEIGIVGVGEATLPHLRFFLERLGIDEVAFMRATHATFKLGIAFEDFGAIGDRYIHPFGTYGAPLSGVGFHHYWLSRAARGPVAPIGSFAAGVVAAQANRFARPPVPNGDPRAAYGYAYQFDATRFAPFLRNFAEQKGVVRTEGKIVAVKQHPENGDVIAVELENGQLIEGDLFIDCSGFRALLIGGTLCEGWEDWSNWLPCNRAVAVPCGHPGASIEPVTRATAMQAGWRWRIPLAHRVGNGYVFSSDHLDETRACDDLLSALDGPPLAEPRILRFCAGRRQRSWTRNVVAIGLASGFLEPLESTSLYLVQMAITELIEHFPIGGIADADRDHFNARIDAEYGRIRDFLILHYNATTRDDSPFWDHVRTMRIPDSLAEKTELWRGTAQVHKYSYGLFLEPSWIAVYLGQGIVPYGWDARADLADAVGLDRALSRLQEEIAQAMQRMAPHAAVLADIHRSSGPEL